MSRPKRFTETPAIQLRAITAQLWSSSPVVLRTPDGKLFRLTTYETDQKHLEKDGQKLPEGPPRLILNIEEVSPLAPTDGNTAEAAAPSPNTATALSLEGDKVVRIGVENVPNSGENG